MLLREQYPPLHRMACGLTGSARVGERVASLVLGQCGRAMDKWRDWPAGQRWFRHDVILIVRQSGGAFPPPHEDVLAGDPPGDTSYLAFVKALRSLPGQQREAFVLGRGEGWSLRDVAVAMDCSTTAASVHLEAAEKELIAVAGNEFATHLTRLKRCYAQLAPGEKELGAIVERYARRISAPARLGRGIRWVVVLAVLAAVAWAVWRWLGLWS